MPEDDPRPGLRVGGWIPPYSPEARSSKPPIRPVPPASFPPAPVPGFPGWSRRSTPLRRRAALAAVAAATLGVAAVTASALGGNQETGSPAFVAGEVPPAPPPARTVAIAPIPSSEPPLFGSAPTEPVATHRRTSNPPARRIIPMTPVTTPVGVTLRVGETVALTLADRPGLRIRHRYFIARVDAIPAHGGALDRADSSFTVRTGLHNSGCVSLESVNYPGYFLRHQNFALKLHRRDGSGLYDQDATFCPVAIRSGAALVLRSTNYPARFVTESNSRLRLRESAADDALALVPRTVG